jgi:hypothetical protein
MTIESYKEINENPHPEFALFNDDIRYTEGRGYGCGMSYNSGHGSIHGIGRNEGVYLTGDADMRAPGIENNK